MDPGDALVSEAVGANRAGRLTDEQRRAWRSQSRGIRKTETYFAAAITVIGMLVWFAPGPAKYATVKPLAGVACLAIAGFLLWRALSGDDRVTEDVRAGKVQAIDGAITKRTVTTHGSRGSSLTSYYFEVEGRRFEVWRSWYLEAPDAGYVRVFYLPRSARVVNMERLADPEVGDITANSLEGLARSELGTLFSADSTKRAEVRAQGAAMVTKFENETQQAAVPPPPDQRDARPLAAAIVGAWSSPFMKVTFSADGTLSLTMMNGMQRTGHWSVGADGKLHADAMGVDGAVDAWVTGDEMSLALNGRGMRFSRVAA